MNSRGWDAGLIVRSRRTVEPTASVLPVAYVAEKVLRVVNDDLEDDFVSRAIKAATAEAEHVTQRALMLQTWEFVLSGFPVSEGIHLPHPPVTDITTLQYFDSNGDSQTLAGSPAEYRVIPSGKFTKAEVWPLVNEVWPSTQSRVDAVTVTYQAGYATADDIPENILTGISLMVGELYKQRTVSVHAVHNTPAAYQAERFWKKVF